MLRDLIVKYKSAISCRSTWNLMINHQFQVERLDTERMWEITFEYLTIINKTQQRYDCIAIWSRCAKREGKWDKSIKYKMHCSILIWTESFIDWYFDYDQYFYDVISV